MDMDFKGPKKAPVKLSVKTATDEPKELPGFRASSELPEHSMSPTTTVDSVTEKDLADAFENDDTTDPTDLTLDREKPTSTSTPQPITDEKPKKKMNKKQLLIMLGLLLFVILGAGGFLVYDKILNKPESLSSTQTTTKKTAKTVTASTVPAPITGIDTSPASAQKPVTAIMIENSVDARPQSGLSVADMVVEAVAEGGITRFVALFQQGAPESIGPIRSARPYYVDIARTFDAAYVHAGGSDDGLARIKELGVKDMSAFEDNGTYIRLDSRAAPHNLYSTTANIDKRRDQLGYKSSTFTSWKHKSDTAQTPTNSVIHLNLGSPLFSPEFTYDGTTNTYKRSINGEAQTDAGSSNKQIAPKVVIGLITNKGQNGSYSTYRLTGTGEMQVFQDGIVSTGTWSKESASAQFVFKDKNGLDFAFNKGQVWMTLLGSSSDIALQQ